MIITVTIQGGATLCFQGTMADDIYSVMQGYADEKDLMNPDLSVTFRDVSTTKQTPEATEVTV